MMPHGLMRLMADKNEKIHNKLPETAINRDGTALKQLIQTNKHKSKNQYRTQQ